MLEKLFRFTALSVAALCWAQLAAAQAPPPARAREAVDLVIAGKYADLLAVSTPDMKRAAPVELWENKVAPMLAAFGKPIEFGQPASTSVEGNTVVTWPVRFEKVTVEFTVSVTPTGRIAGLFIRPPKPPTTPYVRPAYSQAGAFTEREVTVGADEWKLAGTLLLPVSAKPAPAVVLVHGSGPNDRDETILGNKPFRDLAEGLASRGIAVLRYEKRTKVYGMKMAALHSLTVREETLIDAQRAAELLRGEAGIDARRIFYLGHSMGGYLLPWLLLNDPHAAGGISLAGNTRPIEDLVIEQTGYLLSLQSPQAAGAKQLESVQKEVAAIRALEPGKPDGGMLLGAYPAYWLYLRGYDPPAVAAGLQTPLLILQGERDYQVTMQDFGNWKAALGERKNVTLKSYPALNHLFMEGTGKSTPEEYAKPGHVSADVINDVAQWVLAQ
jgi:dienelactone hydrolase